jgi:hypothetical protein
MYGMLEGKAEAETSKPVINREEHKASKSVYTGSFYKV